MKRWLMFNAVGASTWVLQLALMWVFVQVAHLHYLVANALAVAVCSVVNFVVYDRVVFMRVPSARSVFRRTVWITLLFAAGTADAGAADLNPAASQAFDRYARLTEARLDEEREGKAPFLWVDRQLESDRQSAYSRLRRGDIVVSRVQTQEGGASIRFPDALCHHWIGTALMRGVRLAPSVGLMQDYEMYPAVYRPEIRKSRVMSRQGNGFTVYLQLFMKKVVSVVVNSELVVDYLPVSASRMQVRSHSTKIAEVSRPDTPDEHEEPVGRGSGYLWRFNNYCALEERSEGTYVQCESISLSRDIPFGLGWLVGPFVNDLPKESLEFTLAAMRKALRTPLSSSAR